MTTIDNCLKKHERLKSKQELIEVLKKGDILYAEGLKIIFLKKNIDNKHTQIGISVPKKIIRKAVERNRIKRLIRNAYRLNKSLLNNTKTAYSIFFIWIKNKLPFYSEIEPLIKKNLNCINQEKT